MDKLEELQFKLRELSKFSVNFMPDHKSIPLHAFPTELRGYSEAMLNLAVCKKINPPEFAIDQARFMQVLGEDVCPKILAITEDCYFMEYLYPPELNEDSLVVQENILIHKVWDYGRIHGDPTLDNVLMTKQGFIRITDPIPPKWLRKPSILAVDHGKMLQSLLGWEVVLRGASYMQYTWPKFMNDYQTAQSAVFWAKVAVERIAKRDINDRITQWATHVALELEGICG
jgi:hypothetical protein